MTRSGLWRPRARRRGLVVVRLPDETLVYDQRRARAFCLEGRLARLWRWADGKTTLAAIVRRARRRLGKGTEELDASVVAGALGRLRRARLLEPEDGGPRLSRKARRDFLRRSAAIGGLALLEVAAPTAADAATCVPYNTCRARSRFSCGGERCCSDPSGQIRYCSGPGQCSCRR